MEGSAEREIFKQLVGSRTRRTRQCLVFFVALICLLYGGEIWAEGVRGVFGVPSPEKVKNRDSANTVRHLICVV